MREASKAVIRECVHCRTGEGIFRAPAGEYEITRTSDNSIDFSGAESRFTFSLDALLQHLCEGRIALIGGPRLPAPALARARR